MTSTMIEERVLKLPPGTYVVETDDYLTTASKQKLYDYLYSVLSWEEGYKWLVLDAGLKVAKEKKVLDNADEM